MRYRQIEPRHSGEAVNACMNTSQSLDDYSNAAVLRSTSPSLSRKLFSSDS